MLFFIIPMTIITILYILIGLKLRRPKVQNPDKRDQILILTTAGEITQQHEDHDDLSPYIIHNQSTKRVVKMLGKRCYFLNHRYKRTQNQIKVLQSKNIREEDLLIIL